MTRRNRWTRGLVTGLVAGLVIGTPVTSAEATPHRSTPMATVSDIPAFGPQGHSGSISLGHRGNSAERPENTVVSLTSAAAEHADYAEVDVRLTQDDVLVLMHDNNMKRTTDIESVYPVRKNDHVEDFTFAELQQLDAGSWFDNGYTGTRIPSLAQALAGLAGTTTGLLVELKINGINQKVADVIDDFEDDHPGHPVAVASINTGRVDDFHTLAPDIPTGVMALHQDTTTQAQLDGYAAFADFAIYKDDIVTTAAVNRVHDAGMLALHNTSTRAWMGQSSSHGVDGTMSDYPHRKYNQRIGTTGRSYQAESFVSSSTHSAPVSAEGNTYLVGGKFSENEHLRLNATSANNYVEITFNNASGGLKEWEIVMVKSDHFGIVDVELDGQLVINDYDAYRPSMSRETVMLGDRSLSVGTHTLRFTVTGKAADSLGFRAGFDVLASRPA